MTAVATRVVHDWRLVAPWWHWPRVEGLDGPALAAAAEAARRSAPALQKYDTPDLVNTVLADPQRRLAFRAGTDEVNTVKPGPHGLGSLPTRTATGRRKLYLGSHHRHYLVLTSLHCAVAGFPHVVPDAVCDAGFVVRRRSTTLGDDQRRPGAALLTRLAAARRRREGAEAQVAAAAQAGHAGALRLGALQARLRSLARIEQDATDAVRTWATDSGVTRELQGWVPRGIDAAGDVVPVPACGTAGPSVQPLAGVGAWQPVAELPETVDEAAFPLHPLVADPTRPGHDAAGETLYFGVVPTGSADTDPSGKARFDDRSVYEIRCFVRRHRPECPRTGAQCRCPVTWSEPAEAYQLAGQFDLEGTANRPVTVQLPDLAQLQADALRLGPGGTGGVRFQYPPGSALAFTSSGVDATAAGPNSGVQVCSFAIPLITIVALFVFKLFLPIVVFVFQLWFLLALKFCIPPDVQLDAGGELDLALQDLGVGLDIKLEVAAKLAPGGTLAAAFEKALTQDAAGKPALLGESRDKNGKSLMQRVTDALAGGALDPQVFAALGRNALAQGPRRPPDQVGTSGEPVFAPRVERAQVVAP